ncbi:MULTISPECIES: ABC transporter ATP-binding protein [Brucella]|uniref:ABC transporter ATP-binding protein n=1 Tax=Brucella lupini TaxID=255457 RepID=A0A256GB00_9HYPH|nr:MULTISPECIES: ABC transporter ATP-binding protein [Brucella]RNL46647.1 ABC transporter ATP-binding protein [Ochrobactrum sp. MH181795]KAB2706150.1 ABC transporter ATP-binding protein [Brucella lupini]KAB2725958.1 ABC transporter ATP-binding protein [Brucella anthropi]KAB2743270.1 ABC transporter ATP-binding protein [Brucella anthropi]KAB2798442.1 ABC transporter ATP-binding protein [Brucella anthropi]
MLKVEGLQNAYGQSRILFGIDFEVSAGEVVTILGRNGMGKTTTIKSIFGLLPPKGGKVFVNGHDVTGKPPYAIAREGLGLVPEGRQIFPTLSVEENLLATRRSDARSSKWTLESIYRMFPRLKERRRNMGNQLSGGEQQMLAVGRALMTNPKMVVLDEATEGLSPLMREEIWSCLRNIKDEGEAILVIDKNVDALARFADRHVVIEKGRVVWSGDNAALLTTPDIKERYLHV